MTAIAVSIGLGLANIVRPGVGFSQETRQQLMEGAAAQSRPAKPAATKFVKVLISLPPDVVDYLRYQRRETGKSISSQVLDMYMATHQANESS